MKNILSRERIIRMQAKTEDPTAFDSRPLAQYVHDLIAEREVFMDIIRVQLESSGDCRCMGCQRGREALEKAR